MKIEIFRFNLFEENTYVVYDDTKECVIIDPGCSNDREQNFFVQTLDKLGLKPVMIANTHCHSDHILGVKFLKDKYNIPFAANTNDKFLLDNAGKYAQRWGWQLDPIAIDIPCAEGTELKFGNSTLKCMETPGHTPGGQIIYSEAEKYMFSGDTLFKGTIGRTDLEGGDYDKLMESIKGKILRFDSEYEIFPGHGERTSVSIEMTENPFVEFD